MEKNVVINNELFVSTGFTVLPSKRLVAVVANCLRTLCKPLAMLSAYYSVVLQRRVSRSQCLLLLRTQGLFFLAVFPLYHFVLLHLVIGAAFVASLLQCKHSFAS